MSRLAVGVKSSVCGRVASLASPPEELHVSVWVKTPIKIQKGVVCVGAPRPVIQGRQYMGEHSEQKKKCSKSVNQSFKSLLQSSAPSNATVVYPHECRVTKKKRSKRLLSRTMTPRLEDDTSHVDVHLKGGWEGSPTWRHLDDMR